MMSLVGLDLNATRARAVAGPLGQFPCGVPLEPPHPELPLALGLSGHAPEVGSAGVRLCRRLPHLSFHNYLATLGDAPDPSRSWLNDPHRLDGIQALRLVLGRLRPLCRGSDGVVLSLPDYLTVSQVQLLTGLVEEAELPVLGSLVGSLALALTAYSERAWFGTTVILDVDEHALTLATVQDAEGQAHLLDTQTLPRLGLAVWKERLLNALADCCILQSRRDPRVHPEAEQSLYEQIDGILESCRLGRLVNVVFQTPQWYQNLVLQAEDTAGFGASLVRQVLGELAKVFQASWPKGPPRVVLFTAAAGLLPGLVAAVQGALEAWEPDLDRPEANGGSRDHEDFGEGLLHEDGEAPANVVVLSPDAAARGAHALAAHLRRAGLPRRHLESVVPLPLPLPPEAGPARLHFHGQDYLLNQRPFRLGRQADADLAFDRVRYPHVAPCHAEILYDLSKYVLRDRSREGTWVNDRPVSQPVVLRPGDLIRLGAAGPLLRYLGQPANTEISA